MKNKALGFIAATMMAPMAAQASTVGVFDVTAAQSERNGKAVSLWFDAVLAEDFELQYTLNTPGSFIADDFGAVMTGSTVNLLDDSAGFDFTFIYDRDFSDNTVTAPEFKAVWEETTEHGNEDFFDFEGGTVTGTGGFEGLNFELVRAPADGRYVHQTGGGLSDEIGANQHTRNFGLSGWMSISVVEVDLALCTACTLTAEDYLDLVGTASDVNVDLTPASVPLPATGMMLLTAMGGFGALARHRRRQS